MITVTKQENGVLFTFQDSNKYLYGSGTIEVPFNSLSIIQDESDMITLRKSASNDIFLAARYDTDLGYRSKDEAVEALKGMLYDEDTNAADIADIWDTIDEKEEVIASALTDVRQDVADIDARIAEDEEVTAAALNNLDTRKLDASAYTPTDLSQYWTSAQTQSAIDNVKAYYIDFGVLTTQGIHDADWDGLVNAINAHRPIYAKLDREYYTAECLAQSGNQIIMTASNNLAHFFYTFTKNGSENYSFSYETKPYVTDAEKDSWNAKQDALHVYTENNNLGTAELHSNDSSIIFNAGGTSITTNNPMGINTFNVAGNGVTINGENVVTEDQLSDYQPILSAGTGIEISGNVISATGGGSVTVDPTLDTGSTNPVANSAITTAMNAKADKDETLKNWSYSETNSKAKIIFIKPNDNGAGAIFYSKINNHGVLAPNTGITNFSLVETSAITSAITSASTNDEVAGAKAVYDAIQAGGGGITVDSALSSTSVNPVQNSVIYAKFDEVEQVTATALNELNDKLGDIETLLAAI